jgi:hypothetical protein
MEEVMRKSRFSMVGVALALVLSAVLVIGTVQAQIIEDPCETVVGYVDDQTINSGEEFAPVSLSVKSECEYTLGVLGVGDLTVTIDGNRFYITYPEGWIGAETITFYVVDRDDRFTRQATFTVLPPGGSICGTITYDNAAPVEGITVRLLDDKNNLVVDPIITGPGGTYLFADLDYGIYSVGIVTPPGFEAIPAETQTRIEPSEPCTEVDFVLTPIPPLNESRTMGFWKHQFDVYLSGHGDAAIAEADLHAYLEAVYEHFDVLGIYSELGTFDFGDAKDALAVLGNEAAVERAKQQLFAMLLNFAAGYTNNYLAVTADPVPRMVCEVITYAANAIKNGGVEDHELAADVCTIVNRGGLVPEGIVDHSSIIYKLGDGSLPNDFRLEQNHPNPFNPATEVQFYLPEGSHARLEVYNIFGQRVTVLADGYCPAGWHTFTWNAGKVASGVYMYRLTAGDFVESKKMILIK